MNRTASVLAGAILVGVAAALVLSDANTQSGYVDRVIDGDTILLDNGKRIRLWGIDAPERSQTCSTIPGCGADAEAYLRTIAIFRRVNCKIHDTDRYHREVGQCFVDGVDIGALMVANGYAIDYATYSKGYYRDHQQAAQSEKLGVWAGPFEMPAEWRKKHRAAASPH